MNGVDVAIFLGLTFVGFVFSSLFSGMETGLYTINRVRLAVRAARGEATALRLRHELGNSSRALTVLLIGNNAANYLGSFGLAETLHRAGLNDWTLIVVEALIFTPLLFIFGETLPKDLFRAHTDHWTYRLSRFLTACRWLFLITGVLPAVLGIAALLTRAFGRRTDGPTTARQRVIRLLHEGVGTGIISESQTTLADRALALRGRTVGDEMIPWSRVAALPIECGRVRREEIMRRHNFTRLPVLDRSGEVAGVVATIDVVLAPENDLQSMTSTPPTFTPDTPVHEALWIMRTERQPMAIVKHPHTGRPVGLVTLKDLVEPLTGELAAW
ncbi:MAG: DUF21 domain-containing protein [Phycisphaerales bacterium]|nr:MAG: DUF21 domain-containing protein [Phycisphaerales bacterium]